MDSDFFAHYAQAMDESRREREFYRYYDPIRSLSAAETTFCDLNDEAAVLAHRPISSPDRALTAFCQLGALRLGTRRAMMFFFDTSYAYILAEATQTLSLLNDSVHGNEDHLWMGNSVIPRGFSVCEHTASMIATPDSTADQSGSQVPLHVVSDLREDIRFCDRPFVLHGPKARFYAGVPITTPKGINIGAYCVLDDKVRAGLDETGRSFLRDMSTTIMSHLEMVRARSEHERGTQMVAGLGAFVEGGYDLRKWEKKTQKLARRYPSITHLRTSSMSARPSPSKMLPGHGAPASPLNATFRVVPRTASTQSLREDALRSSSKPAPKPLSADSKGGARTQPAPTNINVEKHRDLTVASNVRKTFQRASNLIKESMEVDGVVFLDASIGTYGGLVDSMDRRSSSDLSSEVHTATEDDIRGPTTSSQIGDPRPCSILGSSLQSSDDNEADGDVSDSSLSIPERFLKLLLRKYPRGKVWNFSEEGDASSDDESSGSGTSHKPENLEATSKDRDVVALSRMRNSQRRRNRLDDSREIKRLFPGVRSLALVGMWDQIRDRWFAACALWSYSPLRMLSAESEVNFTAAFCDVIMAEIHRLEAQDSDRAKVDFISSISHELRSPLHGILGSVECLQEQTFDSFSSGLISQVDICGRTLLDIVDHLLDFSKISQHVRKANEQSKGHRRRRRALSTAASAPMLDGTISHEVETHLDKITEEVVEAAVYSYCCSKDKASMLGRRVNVILDIDRSLDFDWACRIVTGGWKRICINLVSNALKYTTEGHIKIALSATPSPNKKRHFLATLTVTDSGRGMSKDFLENHLFRAFSQEDTLMEGTGLGMSLVAKMVKTMGGGIEVRSEKGKGTTTTVTMPLESPKNGVDLLVKPDTEEFKALTMSILKRITPAAPSAAWLRTGKPLLFASLYKMACELGLQTKAVTSLDANAGPPNICLIIEADIDELRPASPAQHKQGIEDVPNLGPDRSVLIVCDTAMSERKLRASHGTHFGGLHLEYVAQPVGPERLRRGIKACLDLFVSAQSNGTPNTARPAQATTGAHQPAPAPQTRPSKRQPAGLRHPNLPLRPSSGDAESTGSPVKHAPPANRTTQNLSAAALEPKARASPPLLTPTKSSQDLVTPQKDPPPTQENRKLPAPPPAPPAPAAPATPSLTILLVDDNQINLQLLIAYTEKHQHRRLIARDGLQAVEAYKAACLPPEPAPESTPPLDPSPSSPLSATTNFPTPQTHTPSPHAPTPTTKPQVILMDINMPILNGFEATQRIRHFESQHNLSPALVIALTGLGSAGAQQEAYSSGVDLFLTKPVRLRELTGVLEGVSGG